jgi:copper oxidase (laccase) domain-containing protein
MLKFIFQDLPVFISERDDGSFRQAQDIQEFLKGKIFGKEDFTLLHLQLENKQNRVLIEKKDLISKKSPKIFIGDAILTNFKKGERGTNKTLISMVVGDCFPIIFFDQKSKNIAMVHAGWQPLYLGILNDLWLQMMELWQAQAKNIWVFLGPGIRADSYCLFDEPRQSKDINWQKFIKQKEKKRNNRQVRLWQIDLPAFIKDFLFRNGVLAEQFIDTGLDTYSDQRFFSHRLSQELKESGQKDLGEFIDGRFSLVCELASDFA